MKTKNCPVCSFAILDKSYCERCSWDLSEHVYWLGPASEPEQDLQERLELAQKNWQMVKLVEKYKNTVTKSAQAFRALRQDIESLKKQHPKLRKDIDSILAKAKLKR